jgi:hypothetical protein
MNGRLTAPLFAVLLCASACAEWLNPPKPNAAPPPADTSVDVSAEPSHHLAFSNPYVRALRVEIEPQGATAKHHHSHDYVSINFGYSELSNEVDGKDPAKLTLNDGDVRYTQGGGPPHLVRNLSPATFRNMTIELLRDEAKVGLSNWGDEDHGVFPFQGGSREILYAVAGVRVSRVELHPGATLPKFSEHALLVAVSDLDLAEEKKPHAVMLQRGSAQWYDGGAYEKVTNKTGKGAKIVLFEFK